MLRYFPTQDGVNLDSTITGYTSTVASVRQKTTSLNNQLVQSLTDGSKYHGYAVPSAVPSLQYSVADDREFLQAVPPSAQFPTKADKFRMFSDASIGVADICSYVDGLGAKEVWIWMYHTTQTVPTESNMSMGTDSQTFWNYSGYGDVSNSARVNDLPICQNTYVVYEYNYSRALGEALEDHGHQLESLFSYAQPSVFDRFVNPHGSPQPAVNHCGNVHSPPNAVADYDWRNETDVVSDCEDWRFEGGGQTKVVDCHTWYAGSCLDDGGAKYKVWWMQNIPGREYNDGRGGGPDYCALRNWWDFTGDFDAAVGSGRSLLAVPNQDVSPPSLALTAPAEGAVAVDTLTVSASASDNGCGVDRVTFTIARTDGSVVASFADTSPPYSVTWASFTAPNGAFHVSASAVDVAGNSVTTSERTIVTNNICSDVTGDGKVRIQDLITLSRYTDMTSSDPGFYAVQHYDLDGNGQLTTEEIGRHYGQDCGYSDTSAPIVTFMNPVEGAWLQRGQNVVDVRSVDTHLTDRVQFYIDGSPASQSLGLIPGDGSAEAGANGIDIRAAFLARIDTSAWSVGAHILAAQATDSSGRSSPLVSITVNISPDSDGDGFDDALEAHVGTDVSDQCADSSTDAAWPPDLNNDRLVRIVDLLAVAQHIGATSASPDWDTVQRRYDLNGNDQVDSGDVDVLAEWYGTGCGDGLPDLIPEPLTTSPATPLGGDTVTISATIRNQGGTVTRSSTSRLRIDLGNDGTWDVQPAPAATGKLGASAGETESWANVWPATIGTHKLEVCADSANVVTEVAEGNNCVSKIITVNPRRASNFTIDANTTTTMKLSWSSVPGAVGYQRCTSNLPHTENWACVNVGNITTETVSVPGTQGVVYYAARAIGPAGEVGKLSNRGVFARIDQTVGGVTYKSYFTHYQTSGGTKMINAVNLGSQARYLGFTNNQGTIVSGLTPASGKLYASAQSWTAADWFTYYGPLIGSLESPNSSLSPRQELYHSTLCMVIDESLCP